MKNYKKYELQYETHKKLWFLRFCLGFKAVFTDIRKTVFFLGYAFIIYLLWQNRFEIFHLHSSFPFASLFNGLFQLALIVLIALSFFFILALLGTPLSCFWVENSLRRIGLTNHAQEAPLVLSKSRDKSNPRISIWEFESRGLSCMEFEDNRQNIEAILNIHVVKFTIGKNNRRILMYSVPAKAGLPQKIFWKDCYLRKENFVLVLGESLLGQETVDISIVPHILIGGSTGSGKSYLFKHVLMQCVNKGAIVYIADFKGVDFAPIWHKRCHIIFEDFEFLEVLASIINELGRRKKLLSDAYCRNLDEYNKIAGVDLPRIIFGCDEIAEVLDKTGQNKEGKDRIAALENKLATIARQGRAFGIHLILATQRPDSQLISGQIRNNLDTRICGRADNILSQIILDSTDASDLIPKDAQGRFLRNDGTIFQAYLFDEKTALGGEFHG